MEKPLRARESFPGTSLKQAVLGTQMSMHGEFMVMVSKYKCENHRRQARGATAEQQYQWLPGRKTDAKEIVAPEVWKEPQMLAHSSANQCRDLSPGNRPHQGQGAPHTLTVTSGSLFYY